jgi:hypothetical protein
MKSMNNKPHHRVVQMRLTLDNLKRYKKALADLDMSATEFLLYSVDNYYKNKERGQENEQTNN